MAESRFRLVSDAFSEGEHIPREYGCDGEDHSPSLRWNGAPEATRSFVLRVVDPDAPDGEFTHWVLFDLPATTEKLETGDSGGETSVGLSTRRNARQVVACRPFRRHHCRKPGSGGDRCPS